MPGRVSEDWQHEGEAQQERYRAQHQSDHNDQSPHRHRHGIFKGGADRRSDRRACADVTVHEHWERDDAGYQHDEREDEADDVADDDEVRAFRGCRELIPELLRCRCFTAKELGVDEVGGIEPSDKNAGKRQAEEQDCADAGSLQNVERSGGRIVETEFPAAAQFVQAYRDEGAEQREAGGHRIDQRQNVVAEEQPRQQESDDRINDAGEKGVCRKLAKVLNALGERIPHIGNGDLADFRLAVPPETGCGPAKFSSWIEDGMKDC